MTIANEPVRTVSARAVAPRPVRVMETALSTLRDAPRVSRPVATVHVRNRWPVILFGTWLAGAILMLARLAWSFVHIYRLRRGSVPLDTAYQDRLRQWLAVAEGPRNVVLRSSDEISIPMSLGPLDPLILMPTDFSGRLTEAEFDQVLLHELAHVCPRGSRRERESGCLPDGVVDRRRGRARFRSSPRSPTCSR